MIYLSISTKHEPARGNTHGDFSRILFIIFLKISWRGTMTSDLRTKSWQCTVHWCITHLSMDVHSTSSLRIVNRRKCMRNLRWISEKPTFLIIQKRLRLEKWRVRKNLIFTAKLPPILLLAEKFCFLKVFLFFFCRFCFSDLFLLLQKILCHLWF